MDQRLYENFTIGGPLCTADEWARDMLLHTWKMPFVSRRVLGTCRIVMGLCLSHIAWNIDLPEHLEPTEEPGEFYNNKDYTAFQHLVQAAEDD